MNEEMSATELAEASKAAFAAGDFALASALRHALEERMGVPVSQLGDGTLVSSAATPG